MQTTNPGVAFRFNLSARTGFRSFGCSSEKGIHICLINHFLTSEELIVVMSFPKSIANEAIGPETMI